MNKPLADKIRPKTLDDVVGQRHILGKGRILRNIIESGEIPSMIFYGPSGTGKTTVANIAAEISNKPLYRLNATNASVSDIKAIVKESEGLVWRIREGANSGRGLNPRKKEAPHGCAPEKRLIR